MTDVTILLVTCLEEQCTPPTELLHQYIRDWREQESADPGSADGDPGGQCSPSFKIKSGSYHSRHVNQTCSDTSWQCKTQKPRETREELEKTTEPRSGIIVIFLSLFWGGERGSSHWWGLGRLLLKSRSTWNNHAAGVSILIPILFICARYANTKITENGIKSGKEERVDIVFFFMQLSNCCKIFSLGSDGI